MAGNYIKMDVSEDGTERPIIQDRPIRQAINELRHQGFPICSSSSGSGYWWAKDTSELYEFIHREIEPRIADLSEQRKAMMLYAVQHTAIQPHLLEVEA